MRITDASSPILLTESLNRAKFWVLTLVICVAFSSWSSAQRIYPLVDSKVRTQIIYSNNLQKIHEQLVVGLENDEQKVRAFYVWISDNISYDYLLYRSKWAKTKLSKQPLKKRLHRTLKKQSAICGGYSELFREFCRLSDISAEVVVGYSKTSRGDISKQRTPHHAWNKVKISNSWKLIDVTWASGFVDKGKFTKRFNDLYFFTPAAKFYHNHFPADAHSSRLTAGISREVFFYLPLVHQGFFTSVNALQPDALKGYRKVKVDEIVTFSFQKSEPIGHITLASGKVPFTSFTTIIQDDIYTISMKFDQPGYHYPTLYVNGQATLTFKVKVMKKQIQALP